MGSNCTSLRRGSCVLDMLQLATAFRSGFLEAVCRGYMSYSQVCGVNI